jgi:hypothetical protein
MLPLLGRLVLSVISSFTSAVLLTVTAIWAIRQSGTSSSAVEMGIFWTILPAAFFVWSIIFEYLEDGNIPRSVRASLFSTACGVAAMAVLWVARYELS